MSITFENNTFDYLVEQSQIQIEKAWDYIGSNMHRAKDIVNDALLDLIESINSFIKENLTLLLFISCSIFTYNHANLRVIFAAGLTFIFQDKQEANPELLSTTNLALNIIGATGLLLHKASYPFSNPFFYFAPCLSGIALAKVGYSLYRKHFPVEE